MSTISNTTEGDVNIIEVKDDESFTVILAKNLEVSIEEGELANNSDHDNPSRISTPIPVHNDGNNTILHDELEPTASTSGDSNPKPPISNVDAPGKKTTTYQAEPRHDYPSYDPEHSKCRKYVPTSEFLFDLYCIIRKANQNYSSRSSDCTLIPKT